MIPSSAAYRTFCHRLRRLRVDECGSVSAELVLAIPALLLLILVIAQFAIWSHATHIAQAAASQALSAARVQGASSAQGQGTAHAVLGQLGGGPLHAPLATVDRNAEQARVDITGEATSVVPFLHLPVRAHAVGPSERFVTPEVGG